MLDQQSLLAFAFVAAAGYMFYKRWKMGGNKVKLREMVQNGAKIIDVRSRGEFAGGHFNGAVNIPLDELPTQLKNLGDKNQPMIVYCASGMRSGSAQRLLQSVGFTNVENGINLGNLNGL